MQCVYAINTHQHTLQTQFTRSIRRAHRIIGMEYVFMRVSLVSISTNNDKPGSERMVKIGGVTSADELTWY